MYCVQCSECKVYICITSLGLHCLGYCKSYIYVLQVLDCTSNEPTWIAVSWIILMIFCIGTVSSFFVLVARFFHVFVFFLDLMNKI